MGMETCTYVFIIRKLSYYRKQNQSILLYFVHCHRTRRASKMCVNLKNIFISKLTYNVRNGMKFAQSKKHRAENTQIDF